MTRARILILGICMLCILSCSSDEAFLEGSLSAYKETTGIPIVYHSLIACAASGTEVLLENQNNKNRSILFYPPPGANSFKYFNENPIQQNYQENNLIDATLETSPILNGYLRRFLTNTNPDRGVVTFILNDTLYISDPIVTGNETVINPSGTNIDQSSPLSPKFSWQSSSNGSDVIYFQVVADSNGNLLSGTYTYDLEFTFYDLSNVVLNIRDIDPPPTLESNTQYQFIMMAVSEHNWVNTLVDTAFTTN